MGQLSHFCCSSISFTRACIYAPHPQGLDSCDCTRGVHLCDVESRSTVRVGQGLQRKFREARAFMKSLIMVGGYRFLGPWMTAPSRGHTNQAIV